MKRLLGTMVWLLVGCTVVAQDTVAPQKVPWSMPDYSALHKGKKYVPFSLTVLDGKPINNETCKGKVTFINFWFEGCAGCRQEFAELNELYDSLKNDSGCQFVAITYDDAAILPPFIKQYNLRFPIATTGSNDKLHYLNYGMGCPSVIVLDKQGRIIHIDNNSITRDVAHGRYDLSITDVLAMIRKAEAGK